MISETTILISTRLIALALVLQSIENLRLRSEAWPWSIVGSELSNFSKKLLSPLFSPSGYSAILILQLACAALLVFFTDIPLVRAVLLLILFLTTLAVSIRWRGAFNGGADSMTLIVLGLLSAASFFSGNAKIVAVCLGYISVQVCLSYFISGIIKLRSSNWRNGKALTGFLRVSNFNVPASLSSLTNSPTRALALSWILILFELSFPVVLLNGRAAAMYIAAAFVFHLMNFYAFGLNRFLFAWAAAYATIPATIASLTHL